MIAKNMPEYFKRFFYSGLNGKDDKDNILEYIIYQSTKEMHDSYDRLEKLYKSSNEEQKQRILSIAIEYYKQYYRFITLNDQSENYSYKAEKEYDYIRSQVINKYEELKNKDIITSKTAGIFISGEREANLLNIYNESQKGNIDKGWIDVVFIILKKLKRLEETDVSKYEEKWLITKLARSIKRKNKEEFEKTLLMIKENRRQQNKQKDKIRTV